MQCHARVQVSTADDVSDGEPRQYLLLQRSDAVLDAHGSVQSVLPLKDALEAVQVASTRRQAAELLSM